VIYVRKLLRFELFTNITEWLTGNQNLLNVFETWGESETTSFEA